MDVWHVSFWETNLSNRMVPNLAEVVPWLVKVMWCVTKVFRGTPPKSNGFSLKTRVVATAGGTISIDPIELRCAKRLAVRRISPNRAPRHTLDRRFVRRYIQASHLIDRLAGYRSAIFQPTEFAVHFSSNGRDPLGDCVESLLSFFVQVVSGVETVKEE